MKRPNILYIFTDQQSASMMSCTGNRYLRTPAMDSLARNGTRFTRAYTTNPVCVPSRISMMTGRYASVLRSEDGNPVRENRGGLCVSTIGSDIAATTLGALMADSGYDLYYGGKEHLPEPLLPVNQGFNRFSIDERENLAYSASRIIRQRRNQPFFMVLSFCNPHDICYMAIRDFAETEEEKGIIENGEVELKALDDALRLPEETAEDEFFDLRCPPLPGNHEVQRDEPDAIRALIVQRPFRKRARESYGAKSWRMHRWAYCRLTEVADRQIHIVLDALRETGIEEETLIIFSSDHGDNDASHRLEHKTTLYEEAANVPFVVSWKGVLPAGRVDCTHLVSTGLDILPTVCDFADVHSDSGLDGRSLRPLLEGSETGWRHSLGVESEIGRAVIGSDGLKYIRYDAVGTEERIHDLNRDPGETVHFTGEQRYADRLERMRCVFGKTGFPGTAVPRPA